MKKHNSSVKSVGVGVALGAAAVAGALAEHFLLGKENTKNRKLLKGWALKAKGEILEQLESLEKVSEQGYHLAVDKVAKKYGVLKHVDKKDLEDMATELKSYWQKVVKRLK